MRLRRGLRHEQRETPGVSREAAAACGSSSGRGGQQYQPHRHGGLRRSSSRACVHAALAHRCIARLLHAGHVHRPTPPHA